MRHDAAHEGTHDFMGEYFSPDEFFATYSVA
jgi:hypothetical protein